MLSPNAKRRIKRELSTEKATVHIGKEGMSKKLIDEIDRQLQDKEILKIKVLKTALEKDKMNEIAMDAAQRTKAILIDIRGHTFILYRRKRQIK
jgi:RNA-binding protein